MHPHTNLYIRQNGTPGTQAVPQFVVDRWAASDAVQRKEEAGAHLTDV